jgi:hypothetical protein
VKTVRAAAVAALVGSIVVSGATPALAAGDTTPPTVVTDLRNGQLVPRTARFNALVHDNVGIKKVEVLINGDVYLSAPVWIGPTAVTFSPELDGKDVNLTVRAYDAAGNTGEATTRVRVDASGPRVVLTPGPGSSLKGVVTINADVSADTAELTMYDGQTGALLARRAGKPWTITWNTAGQSDNPYFRATDAVGNVSNVYTDYRVDNEAPTIGALRIAYQVDGRRIVSATPRMPRTATLTADVADLGGVDRIEWWSGNVKIGTGASVTWNAGPASRAATVQVRAWDSLGNAGTKSFAVRVDTAGPVITSITPANRALVRGSHVTSVVRATDPSGVYGAFPADNRADYKAPFTGVFPVTLDGPRTLTWTVVDALGNKTTAGRVVIVDNTRPSLAITKAPGNGARVSGTVKVSASAGDKNGIGRVELLINGKIVARDTRAGYNFSIKTSKYGKKLKVQLRAYDKAGNLTGTSVRTWYR